MWFSALATTLTATSSGAELGQVDRRPSGRSRATRRGSMRASRRHAQTHDCRRAVGRVTRDGDRGRVRRRGRPSTHTSTTACRTSAATPMPLATRVMSRVRHVRAGAQAPSCLAAGRRTSTRRRRATSSLPSLGCAAGRHVPATEALRVHRDPHATAPPLTGGRRRAATNHVRMRRRPRPRARSTGSGDGLVGVQTAFVAGPADRAAEVPAEEADRRDRRDRRDRAEVDDRSARRHRSGR